MNTICGHFECITGQPCERQRHRRQPMPAWERELLSPPNDVTDEGITVTVVLNNGNTHKFENIHPDTVEDCKKGTLTLEGMELTNTRVIRIPDVAYWITQEA